MTDKILAIIQNSTYESALTALEKYIPSCKNIKKLLQAISIIPEALEHDSTGEKLWAKASDIALSSAFIKLGLKSTFLHTRGDSADVIAESRFHEYSLVADAKSFRLSRTAKNQKDFKIGSLSAWRKDCEYAILCAPYFQYPASASQIYKQAIENNVCLFSWEYINFLLENNIRETHVLNLASLWNFSSDYGKNIIFSRLKNCFFPQYNTFLCAEIDLPLNKLLAFFNTQIGMIKKRGLVEARFWRDTKSQLLSLTREQAIEELIRSKKIEEKINRIMFFIQELKNEI